MSGDDRIARQALGRDEEKWHPVFLTNHATTRNLWHDDVSIKHHHAIVIGTAGLSAVVGSEPVMAMQMMQAVISDLSKFQR